MNGIHPWGATATLLLAAAGGSGAQITQQTPMSQHVTVHVGAAGKQQVPPEIFGSFLEPIGNSINNGIAAEILVNRSFEAGLWNHTNLENLYREQPELVESANETGIPLPWQSLDKAAGNRFELHVGQAANSWQSLEIMGRPDELTGIMQKVYLPVQRVLRYRVSLYARHISGPAAVTASLRDRATGKTLAEATVEAAAAGWTKYTADLALPPGAVQRLTAVNFALAVTGDERAEFDQVSLLPADAIGTLDPDAVAMAKAMHLTELRFGGNFSSYYHWRDGVGPEDKRPTLENIAWGIPEYNNFGTDEFLQLCDLIGAVPQFNLNMGSGTPEEAAEWVRYIHARHPGRVLYEMGNELYGKWQVGAPTPAQIAPRTLQFSKAVRAADPDAERIATGQVPATNGKWNEAQLGLPVGTFQDLSLHTIYGMNRTALDNATPQFVAAADYAAPVAIGALLDKAGAQIAASPMRGTVHLAITEWLFNSKGYGERNFTNEAPSWMNQGGGGAGRGISEHGAAALRHRPHHRHDRPDGVCRHLEAARAGIRRACVLCLSDVHRGKGRHGVAGIERHRHLQCAPGRPRPGDRERGTGHGRGGHSQCRRQTLTLLCVNRSLEQALPTTFKLDGLHAAGTASTLQLSAPSRYERNDEVEPQHILPVPGSLAVQADGGLTLILPPESVTRIQVALHEAPPARQNE